MKSALRRFFDKVPHQDEGKCWLWTGEVSSNGYGRFWDGKRKWQAHRWIYRELVGDLPDDKHCCHRCDVQLCVNPSHLFIGTNALKTRCLRGHEFAPSRLKPNGYNERTCPTCMTAHLKRKTAARVARQQAARAVLEETG